MALLTEAQRKKYFEELGLGEYNKTNILKLQKKYLLRKSDWDGIYGQNTDNLLRHLMAVHENCKNFAPEEFRCGCNGRHCCGYPTWMKPMELANIQKIRDHYGKPMVITCGLRCPEYNSEVGGIPLSEHKKGLAVDYYIAGVTDTLDNRRSSIKWICKLPNHHYTYGNGIYAETNNGKTVTGSVSAPGMGNAMHTDSREGTPDPTPTPTPTPEDKLVVDGIGGYATVKRMQEFFSTLQDGVISGQNSDLISKYCPSLTAVSYNNIKSTCIVALQKWLGVTADGIIGKTTVKAWQKKLGVTVDGIFGTKSMKAWQKYLNSHDKPDPAPTPKKYTKMIDVSEFQGNIDWSKVKADGVKGVIIRVAGRGGESGDIYDDTKFMTNIKGAHEVGLPVGIYFLTQAINAAEGKAEAQYIIKKWAESGIPISYPICIDSEDVSWKNKDGSIGYGRAHSKKLSKAKRTEAIKAFRDECNRQGFKSMLYASTAYLEDHIDMKVLAPLMDVWVAQYYSECQYDGDYIIWQYTDKGSVKGISDIVDMDKCYVDPKAVDPPKTETIQQKICKFAKKEANSGTYHYVEYSSKTYTHQCPVCHKRDYDKGGNCYWWPIFCWKHGGGIKCNCSCDYLNDAQWKKLLSLPYDEALALAKKKLGNNNIELIRNKNGIPQNELKASDICCHYYSDGDPWHVTMYVGDGKLSDCSSSYGVRYGFTITGAYKIYPIKVAIRYTGK